MFHLIDRQSRFASRVDVWCALELVESTPSCDHVMSELFDELNVSFRVQNAR